MPETFSVLAGLAANGRRMQSRTKPLKLLSESHKLFNLFNTQTHSWKGILLRLLMFSSVIAFDSSAFRAHFAKLGTVRLRPVLSQVVTPVLSIDDEVVPNKRMRKFPSLRPIKHAVPAFGGSAMVTHLASEMKSDVVDVGLQHGELLPKTFSTRIPARDEQILNFLMTYLEAEGLDHINVFINGGYVRDLLMGNEPDDLDLSLDLRSCSDKTTVTGLLEKTPDFAKERPELGITEIDIKFNLNEEAEMKQIDSFKSFFHNDRGQVSEVDVLPTCGDEIYEVGSRIPYRNWRASPQEDALRRDLTVGAMLLQVDRGGSNADGLSYRLFDFYGGVADLAAGVLQAPIPTDKSYESLVSLVLQTAEQRDLARALELSSLPEPEAVQILWWAKALMDDPIRVCRALRFSATLHGFQLHKAFWDAVPFALLALHSSVAGKRKKQEYLKIAKRFEPCVYFVELAFTKTFGPSKALKIKDSGLHGNMKLASSLFGGRTDSGDATCLPEPGDFDIVSFRTIAASLAPPEGSSLEPDEMLIGVLLAATASADGLECSQEEFSNMCDGLQATKFMRQGIATLRVAREWAAEEDTPNVLDSGFAAACGISPNEMHLYSKIWQDLFTRKADTMWNFPRRDLAYKLAQRFMTQKEHSDPRRLERLAEALWIVSRPRPAVKGSIFSKADVLNVPPPLRGQVMSLLEVGSRLLGYDAPLQDVEDFQALFLKFPKIREALSQQNLDLVCPPRPQGKKKKKNKKEQMLTTR